jgi:dihydrofolate reductase
MCGPNGELDWHFSNWNDEMGEYALEQLRAVDTILVGRVTYESMANYWPKAFTEPGSRKKDVEFAKMMNEYPKIVFSNTLKRLDWNNARLAKNDIAEEVAELKKQHGKDMIIWGGVGIVYSFIELGLIDEYRIWVSPVAIGDGIPLFSNLEDRLDLKLIKAMMFSNGVVLLEYGLKPISIISTR